MFFFFFFTRAGRNLFFFVGRFSEDMFIINPTQVVPSLCMYGMYLLCSLYTLYSVAHLKFFFFFFFVIDLYEKGSTILGEGNSIYKGYIPF